MIDRHLTRDVALAALIALPAVLPTSVTPRSLESHIGAQGSQVTLADAAIDDAAANPLESARGRS